MYGSGGAPLYVGKSVSIKERVLSHFAADIRSSSEMKIAQQLFWKSCPFALPLGEVSYENIKLRISPYFLKKHSALCGFEHTELSSIV